MLKQERKKGSFERGLMETQRALLNSLASTDNLSKGLHLCLEACLQVSDMDCGGIYLIDDTTGNLNLYIDGKEGKTAVYLTPKFGYISANSGAKA